LGQERTPATKLDVGFLAALSVELGFDATVYDRPDLGRRLERVVSEAGIASIGKLPAHVKLQPLVRDAVIRAVAPPHSRFFRNFDEWGIFVELVMRSVAAFGREEIGVWSCGCGRGEEPYSVRIAFHGREVGDRLRITATDISDNLIADARSCVYFERQVEKVPMRVRGKYFIREGRSWRVRPALARDVKFVVSDALTERPGADFDAVLCRNLLMYLTDEGRGRLTDNVVSATRIGGIIWVGGHESLTPRPPLKVSRLTRDIYRRDA
jgi:chemotaxis protein methyltransferase CheR